MIPKVSILVPVYNASKYIERCAHSLFQQTFEDIEYVFVNDCTPDDSIEKLQKVIEQYPNRKDKIKIIDNKFNRGTAASRQTGIDNSTGKYVLFVDNDDWVNPDMIETMYKKAETEQADIVVCDYVVEKKNSQEYSTDYVPDNKDDYFRCMLENKMCDGYLWNKLIRRFFFELQDCRFVEGLNYIDDRFALTRIYFYANKIVKIDKVFYHYNRTNVNAQTATKTSWHFENVILFWNLMDIFLKEKGIYNKYADLIESLKADSKVPLITQTNSYKIRKQYSWLFRDIEMKHISRFRFGERLVLFFTHYKIFILAHLVQKLIVFKNRNE